MTTKPDQPALRATKVLHAQWSDMPEKAVNVVKSIWRLRELGNDHYYYNTCISELEELQGVNVEEWCWGQAKEEQKGWVETPLDVTPLVDFARDCGLEDREEFLLHWWW